jgi:mRNA interferase RelE/StbE
MNWRVVLAPSAVSAVRNLPPDLKRSVKAALDALAKNPHAGKALVTELRGLHSYPMRRYRIVYALDSEERRILVVAVGHRANIYEGLSGTGE